MVDTGYIAFIKDLSGGQDTDGNPITSVKVSTVFVACNLSIITKEYRTLVQGQYLQGNYSVYLDLDVARFMRFPNEVPPINFASITEVQLKDSQRNVLGSFQVQNLEVLNLSKRVKIVV
jgi:hypothetical protein